jgi:hypothetical protein
MPRVSAEGAREEEAHEQGPEEGDRRIGLPSRRPPSRPLAPSAELPARTSSGRVPLDLLSLGDRVRGDAGVRDSAFGAG